MLGPFNWLVVYLKEIRPLNSFEAKVVVGVISFIAKLAVDELSVLLHNLVHIFCNERSWPSSFVLVVVKLINRMTEGVTCRLVKVIH